MKRQFSNMLKFGGTTRPLLCFPHQTSTDTPPPACNSKYLTYGVKRCAVGDVLEVPLQGSEEPDVVLGLHEKSAEVLTQIFEWVVDAAVNLHEALDSRCFQLFKQRAQRCVPLAPVINLCQRTVALKINQLYPIYTIEQTSSRSDGTPSPGSNINLCVAHSWSRVMWAFQLQPARLPNYHAN